MIQVQANLAIDICQRHVAMLAGDVRIAVPAQYTHVAPPRRYRYRGLAWNGDIHIRSDPMIARALRIGAQTYRLTTDRDLRLCAQIPFVRIFLFVGADA